jgi:hypothetical protein
LLDWIKRRFQPAPLTGAPAVRRLKSYQADSGYVYQYTYSGLRRRLRKTEYVFQCSADRRNWFAVSIFLPDAALAAWEKQHARTLTDTERYAVAKLGFRALLDAVEAPGLLREPLTISAADAHRYIQQLDL